MTATVRLFRRVCAAVLTLILLGVLSVNAGAAAAIDVEVTFWKETSDKSSLINEGVDPERQAVLTRQPNGTYTLALPIQSLSRLGVTGHLTGLTIGDIAYEGTVSGSLEEGTGLLIIESLPASVLTGSDPNLGVRVTCSIQTSLKLLGTIDADARLCIWAK